MPRSDAERLRMLAAEAFAKAMEIADPTCRRMMLDMAATYHWLAEGAEAREPGKPPGDKLE